MSNWLLPSFLESGDELIPTIELIMPLQNPNQTVLPHPIGWAQLLTAPRRSVLPSRSWKYTPAFEMANHPCEIKSVPPVKIYKLPLPLWKYMQKLAQYNKVLVMMENVMACTKNFILCSGMTCGSRSINDFQFATLSW